MPTPTPTPPPPTPPPPPTFLPHTGTDCSGAPLTIYTYNFNFNPGDTAFINDAGSYFSGYFIYGGVVYLYSTGISSVITPHYHLGTDCNGVPIQIITSQPSFSIVDTAYSDQCLTTTYNGYFIYNGVTYSYIEGLGDVSTCPTPTYTNPNILKADIHASYETGSGTWQSYRANVTGLFVANSGTNKSDYRDHVIREFNRKISILNQPTGLFISPYDDGFRFTGVLI